jgi:hypothetical protein
MMNFLPVPKYLNWQDTRISQHYHCNQTLLITSGCSFTSSTVWLKGAASWPGYTRDRCGFEQAIDMSFPGAGNFFIADSIKYAIEKCCQEQDPEKILVIVMWSGIDRAEYTQIAETFSGNEPMLDNLVYKRLSEDLITDQVRRDTTNQSLACIKNLIEYLEHKSIAWVFTSYANLLFPPFVPKRDTTHHWQDYLDSNLIISFLIDKIR